MVIEMKEGIGHAKYTQQTTFQRLYTFCRFALYLASKVINPLITQFP